MCNMKICQNSTQVLATPCAHLDRPTVVRRSTVSVLLARSEWETPAAPEVLHATSRAFEEKLSFAQVSAAPCALSDHPTVVLQSMTSVRLARST